MSSNEDSNICKKLNNNITIKLMDDLKLFWQGPVITEKIFFEQNKHDPNYIGMPWTTINDKFRNNKFMLNKIAFEFKNQNQKQNLNANYYTCCQSIYFRRLIPFFKLINIKTLYTPHKTKNENEIQGVKIVACPIYAVNIEDNNRNNAFKNIDFLTNKRRYLYSFMGSYDPSCYLTDVRKKIFEMKHPDNAMIKNSGEWHFADSIYKIQNYNNQDVVDNSNKHIDNKNKYNEILLNSDFSLCPSGSGPNSIRLWESLACGTIPVILADTLDLPKHQKWDDAVIFCQESNLKNIPTILSTISNEKKEVMKRNCIKIYNHFKNNFKNL